VTTASLREVLASFTKDIEAIDMGCPVCVGEFIEGVNEQMEKLGVPYRYRRVVDGPHYGDVVLEEAE